MIALVGMAEDAAHHPDHSAVRHDETRRRAVRTVGGELDESRLHTGEDRFVGLVARWAHVVVEKPGIVTVDLTSGEPLPGSDVDFAESGVRSQPGNRQLAGKDHRGVESPRQIARHDPIETGQLSRGRLGLAPAFGGQGGVGMALHATDRVPFGLAMAHEKKTGRRHIVQAIATGADEG